MEKNVRKFVSLKPNVWTDVVRDLIVTQKPDVECALHLIFKAGRVYSVGEPFLKIYAECICCKASLVFSQLGDLILR